MDYDSVVCSTKKRLLLNKKTIKTCTFSAKEYQNRFLKQRTIKNDIV